jgi:hypothetical protein
MPTTDTAIAIGFAPSATAPLFLSPLPLLDVALELVPAPVCENVAVFPIGAVSVVAGAVPAADVALESAELATAAFSFVFRMTLSITWSTPFESSTSGVTIWMVWPPDMIFAVPTEVMYWPDADVAFM